jgi:twitching motility protein PilT
MAVDIEQLLRFSVKNGASDLHLSSGVPPIIRIDGDVKRINMPSLTHKEVHSMVYDIMNDKQRKDYEEFFETDFSFEIPELARFRVNAFNQHRGAGAVFRTIPSKIMSLDDLNAPKIFKDISMYPRGIVLVTGPTGSGKSTTLAAMIDHVNNNRPDHILTIEDPIEFVHESKKSLINQREVHRDTLGFAEALRSALREDPDVILVGEMRDLETIRLALTAAETGHLVFGTLHTSSAAKTIDRVVDVFPAGEKEMVRSMLSESLRAVISQTLLKKIGGGRVAAHEIMIGTAAIRNLIREGKIAQMYSAIQTGPGDRHADARPVPAGPAAQGHGQPRGSPLPGPEQGRAGLRLSYRDTPLWNATRQSGSSTTAAQDGRGQRLRPVPHGGLPAGDQGRRPGEAGHRPAADAAAERGAGALDHERPADQGIRRDQGMQLRDRAAPHRPLPRQRLHPAGLLSGAVMRTINTKIPTFEELELPPTLKDVAMTKRGLVLIVGGTGSGKSTTLAAMLGYRNENSKGHIITIEDPVEYVHTHKSCVVTQREIGIDTEAGMSR